MPFVPFHAPPLNQHYEGRYDDRELLWRRLGAIDKASNIQQLLAGEPVETVLEVGCGTGAVLAEVARRGIGQGHVGVDVADPADHADRQALGMDMRCYDGKTLPFADASFDLVYASHVIEHVPEPRTLLAEMSRVARRLVYVEVPCELHLRTSQRALQRSLDIGHINAYTPESFQLLLETSSLTVKKLQVFDHSLEVHRFGNGPVAAWLKFGLRRSLLAINARLAARVFTYHCGILIYID